MKTKRQALILEIIRDNVVETQEELAKLLRERDVDVTQATVSRDVKELRLVKVPTGEGHYRYGVPFEPTVGDVMRRARRSFHDYVVEIDYSQNMIILKTLSGTANAVAASIDDLNWPDILATVAGDDTILVIVRDDRDKPPSVSVGGVLDEFRKLRQN
ncbi:MAG: arginine repressor [Firmicutes bacterium]|nr:arginine repressor [Bacillota bacterium]